MKPHILQQFRFTKFTVRNKSLSNSNYFVDQELTEPFLLLLPSWTVGKAGKQPTTNNQQPTTNNQQPTTNNQQPQQQQQQQHQQQQQQQQQKMASCPACFNPFLEINWCNDSTSSPGVSKTYETELLERVSFLLGQNWYFQVLFVVGPTADSQSNLVNLIGSINFLLL